MRATGTSAIGYLRRIGIQTTADLDAWIKGQHRPMSRYGALKELVGEHAAMRILNELAINQSPFP